MHYNRRLILQVSDEDSPIQQSTFILCLNTLQMLMVWAKRTMAITIVGSMNRKRRSFVKSKARNEVLWSLSLPLDIDYSSQIRNASVFGVFVQI
jgi:hypothetical protein